MTRNNSPDDIRGDINIKDNAIHYSGAIGTWALQIDDIRLIGECTNEDGPCPTDWLLVLMVKGGASYCAPITCNGMTRVMEQLREILNTEIEFKLSYSTDFDSRIIFPAELIDKKIFNYELAPPRNLLEKLMSKLGINDVNSFLTEDVIKVVENKD